MNLTNQISLGLIIIILLAACTPASTPSPASPSATPQPTIRVPLQPTITTSPSTSKAGFPPQIVDQLQGYIDQIIENGDSPGMVILIDSPQVRYEGSGGYSNLAKKENMPVDGAFWIGSITKMFTAAVTMQLVEEGMLTLEDPLEMWLPDISKQLPYGDEITIRNLLSHSSGVYNYVNNAAFWGLINQSIIIDEENGTISSECWEVDPHFVLETSVFGEEASFRPGHDMEYSNTGYILLGMVIEEATGSQLVDEYHKRVLDPLGMVNTYLDCYEPAAVDRVHGYNVGFKGNTSYDTIDYHVPFAAADGGMVSTAPDLATFGRMLFSAQLFENPDTLATMLERQTGNYGLGIFVNQQADIKYWGHTGHAIGYTSLLYYLPDYETLLVILFNSDPQDREMIPVMRAARDILQIIRDSL